MSEYDRAAAAWPYREMSPEEFAGKNPEHRYIALEEWTHRPEVYDWLRAVVEICNDPERLAGCRARWAPPPN